MNKWNHEQYHKGKVAKKDNWSNNSMDTAHVATAEIAEVTKAVSGTYDEEVLKDWKPTREQANWTRQRVQNHGWSDLRGNKTEVLRKILEGAAIPNPLYQSIVQLVIGDCIVVLPQWYQNLHKAKYKDVDHIKVSKGHLRIQDATTELSIEGDKEDNFNKTHLIICKVHSTYSPCIMDLSTGLLTVKDMQSRYTRHDVIYHSMRIFMEAVL